MLRILTMAALLTGLFTPEDGHRWTLEECISYALVHNPSVRRADISVKKCRTEAAAALSEWIPEINVYVGNSFSWGRSVDMQELMIVNNRLNYTTSLSAAADIPVTGYVSMAIRRKDLHLAKAESEAEREAVAATLVSDITSSFCQLLLSEETCRTAENGYDELLLKRSIIDREVTAGLKPQIELIRIDSRIAEEKAALVEARTAVESDRMTLITLLNLPPEEDIGILPPTEDSLCGPYDIYEAIIREDICLPEVRKAEISLERAKASRMAAKSVFLPEIGISFGYGTYYGNVGGLPFRKQLSANRNPSVEIGLSIPLTGLFEKSKSLKTASLLVADREVEVENARARQRRAVFDDVSKAINLYESLLASKEHLDACRKEYELNAIKIQEGEIAWSDFILSRNSKLRAEIDVIQAKYRYFVKLKEMEFKYGSVK